MPENQQFAACTIVSYNYLGFAAAVCRSYLQFHPGHQFVVLIVDEPAESMTGTEYPFEIVYAKDLPLEDFKKIAFQFDILELNTNVKPTFLKYLLQRGTLCKLIYLDPDIYFYHSLELVLDLLDEHSIILTPHCTRPIQDGFKPSEQDFLRTGVFNLGFLALRNSDETLRMLDWWEERCLTLGYHEIPSGLFVDQKWMNLAPCFFSSVHILKHPGCNMAYWNLHERTLGKSGQGSWIVNGQYPLLFFHFSGITAGDETGISKYQNRYTLLQRTDLAELFAGYRKCLSAGPRAGLQNDYQYSYGQFSNGKIIPLFLRRLFGALRLNFADSNPFDAEGPFYIWADKQGLLGSGQPEKKYTALTYDKDDWRLRVIHKTLRCLLRVAGVKRYTLLMQYLSFISVLRNQALLFDVKE